MTLHLARPGTYAQHSVVTFCGINLTIGDRDWTTDKSRVTCSRCQFRTQPATKIEGGA